MNNHKKGFAHIAFIAIGVVVLVGAIGTTAAIVNKNSEPGTEKVAVSNGPISEIKDWKTYRSEKYGFEFSYPSSLTIDSKNITDDSKVFTPKDKIDMYFFVGSTVGGLGNYKYSTFEEYLSHYSYDRNYDRTQIKFGDLDWNKFVATQNTLSQNQNIGQIRYNFYKDNASHKFYEFVFTGKVTTSNIELFEEIVKTFRLTEKSETAGWKTYINPEYKFQIKYPPTWVAEEADTNNDYFIVKLRDSSQVPPRESGDYTDNIYIRKQGQESCVESDWQPVMGGSIKYVCLKTHNLRVDLKGTLPNVKILEEKMLSSLILL